MSATRRIAVMAVAAYSMAQWLGRTAGSSFAERKRMLLGDELVPTPRFVTNHAVTINAAPVDVWPWLTQMGWHRGGWYTPRWVDVLLFRGNEPSAERLDPALMRELEPGMVIPDGPEGTASFLVELAEAPHRLVLHSTSHVPRSWQDHGAAIDWVWSFELRYLPPDEPGVRPRTRLLLRTRGSTKPWWLTVGYVGLLVPADLVMALAMLHGIRRRVEENCARIRP